MYDSVTGLGHLYMIVPEKDIKTLEILWPDLPESKSKYLSEPLGYISHVLGHEGPNSLVSTLIAEGQIT
jgi:secreted Zn-dependent insulinase-like peptidase